MANSYAVGGDVPTMIECSLEVDRMMDHGNSRNAQLDNVQKESCERDHPKIGGSVPKS